MFVGIIYSSEWHYVKKIGKDKNGNRYEKKKKKSEQNNFKKIF